MWGKFVFREILPPQRLVYLNSFSDADGGLTRHPLMPRWPLELLTTVSFDPHPQGTRLTVRWLALDSATAQERSTFDGAHSSMQQGWGGTLEQLEACLS